jgi:hypothetical protein
MTIEVMLAFAYTNLEYIVAGLGGIGMIVYLKLKKVRNNSNDLTNLIIKQKKYADTVNKRSK